MASARTILRTIPSYFPNVTGPANQAHEAARRLSARGYSSKLVTTTLGAVEAPRQETYNEVKVVRLPIQAGFMQYQIAAGTWRELRGSPADIIHAHCYRNYLADAAGLVAQRRGIPFILQLHGTLVGFRKIAGTGRQWLYKGYDMVFGLLPTLRAQRIIVSTQAEAHETVQYGLDSQRVRVIPMGIDPEQYRFSNIEHDPQQILFVGRISEDRNVEQLLHALGQIEDLPWTCRIVGGEERRSYANQLGYVDRLKRLTDELGIAARVQFTGPLYGEELRRAYASAGIFAYPSRYENFGQTILEAAAAGCALVSTRVGVAGDLIRTGQSGFFIDEDNAGQMAAHLRMLLGHHHHQRAYGGAVQSTVHQSYAWEPILRQYTALYEEVLEERNYSQKPAMRRNKKIA